MCYYIAKEPLSVALMSSRVNETHFIMMAVKGAIN